MIRRTHMPALDVYALRPGCPPWCVSRHDPSLGEEDWLHVGEPLSLDDDTAARLCMSVNPETGAVDGPYVLVGTREYTLENAARLGTSIIALAESGAEPIPPEAGGRHSRDP